MDALGNTNALSSRLNGLMLGTTPAGSAWAYKALHPSDTVVGIGGVPDKSCLYTTFQNYLQQISINATELLGMEAHDGIATPTWSMDIIQSPHPLYPLRIRLWEDVNKDNFKDFVVYNNQLGVTLESVGDAMEFTRRLNEAFMKTFEKYRIAYQGLTINSTASEMFNHGNVTATQYTWPMTYNQNFNVTSLYDILRLMPEKGFDINNLDGATTKVFNVIDPTAVVMNMQCGSCVVRDAQKTYDELIQMPLAYTGLAKLGVYQPLKLTDFDWKKTDDFYYYISDDVFTPINHPAQTDPSDGAVSRFTHGNSSVTTVKTSKTNNCLMAVEDDAAFIESVRVQNASSVGYPMGSVDITESSDGIRWGINRRAIEEQEFKPGPISNIWFKNKDFSSTMMSERGTETLNKYFTNLNMIPIPAFCGDKFGQISFRGLSCQNPLILTFRQGIETVVTPGSILSMYMRPSVTPDEQALMAYAQIVSVLSDAWPAYYNDWNKLKAKLLEAWNWFKPYGKEMLNAVGPIALSALSSFFI